MNSLQKLTKARSLLLLDQPFFGCLVMRLKLKEDNVMTKTLTTDGKEILYNAEFVDTLTQQETVGVLAHETMHVALGHCWRMGKRDSQLWNTACDYPVNEIIAKAGLTLPDGCFFGYPGESAEEIYSKLSKPPQSQDQQSQDQSVNKDPGHCGGVQPPKTEEDCKQGELEWRAAIASALKVTEKTLSADIARTFKEIVDPLVSWKVLLRDFVEKNARNDYDWTKPSKRYINQGIFMPSLRSEELPEVCLVIDTSGSIDEKALSTFLNEASQVLECYDTTARVICCDNRIHSEDLFTKEDLPLKIEPKGFGGTSFLPPFKHLEDEGITPSCLIYFTDLCCRRERFPQTEPDFPVMWLTNNKEKQAPWGWTVLFEDKERS